MDRTAPPAVQRGGCKSVWGRMVSRGREWQVDKKGACDRDGLSRCRARAAGSLQAGAPGEKTAGKRCRRAAARLTPM